MLVGTCCFGDKIMVLSGQMLIWYWGNHCRYAPKEVEFADFPTISGWGSDHPPILGLFGTGTPFWFSDAEKIHPFGFKMFHRKSARTPMSGYKTGALRWLWWTEEPQRVVRFWPPLHGMETTRSTSLPRKSGKFTESGEIHHVPSFLSGILIPEAKRCISAVACWSLHSCLDIMQLSVLSSWVWLENPRFVSIWKFPKSWQYPQIIHFGYFPSAKPSSYWSAIGVPLLFGKPPNFDPFLWWFCPVSWCFDDFPKRKPPNFDDFSSFPNNNNDLLSFT